MSANQSLSELRKGFEDLRGRLYRLCDLSSHDDPAQWGSTTWSLGFKDETSLVAIRLLRSLESAVSDAKVLSDASTKHYTTRLDLELDSFRIVVEGQILPGMPPGGSAANCILKAIDAGEYCNAFEMTSHARGIFFSALEDIRMLYELRLLPMEERDRVRQALVETGMPEVAARLTKADEQRVDDPPACVGHCREALAFTVHRLAETKVGKATNSVQGDLGELGKTKGFLSPEERRVAVALYSYLSSKWKSGEEPKPGDAEFALKQTYFFVDRLLETVGVGSSGTSA